MGNSNEKFVYAGKSKLVAHRGIWEAAFVLTAGDVKKKPKNQTVVALETSTSSMCTVKGFNSN